MPSNSSRSTPDSSDLRRTLWIWIPPLIGTLVASFFILRTNIPLGIPGEWVWKRSPLALDYWWNLPLLLVLVGIFAFWIRIGLQFIRTAKGPQLIGSLLVSSALAFSWLWTVQEAAPGGLRLSKGVFVLYYPGPSGYFTEARYHVDDLRSYLARYTDKLREGDVLHIGTHPPGLIVVYRMLMACRTTAPGLFHLLDSFQPLTFREAGQVLIDNSKNSPTPVTSSDLSILWTATLLVQFISALTIIPLFFLIAEFCSRRSAWLLIHFWPFVPALSLFLPKSDAFFPCLSAAILALWLIGWRRGSFFLCLGAGFVAWLGLFLSLAFLPILFLAAVMTFWSISPFVPQPDRTPLTVVRLTKSASGVILGFWTPVLLLALWAGMNLVTVWLLNYQNHAGFYRQYTRTYAQWLWCNPLELAVAGGLPVFWLAIRSGFAQLANPRNLRFGILLSVGLTWSILWLSGKNMGEAARLWLFLIPCEFWLAAPFLDTLGDSQFDEPPRLSFWVLWTLQVLASLVLAARVTGFDLGSG